MGNAPSTQHTQPVMKASQYLISTLKEVPSDAEVVSHILLLRAGFIRKIASGIYNWLPMGFRVLKKVEAIVREEMDASGALEVIMPVVQPGELWEESGRWGKYDEGLLLKFNDRHQRDFCLGPTHEEVITELARNELRSHRQLPVNLYQIQTKFRDETRPRFGLLRAREFVMKDAYSFHLDESSLDDTYQVMHDTYSRILDRLKLEYRAVLADSGSIGGNASMEFHVLADSGEDVIAFSSSYAANLEKAESIIPEAETADPLPRTQVDTPGMYTINEVASFLKIDATRTVKTLIIKADSEDNGLGLVALVLRGDHQLNEVKAAKLPGLSTPLTFANDAEVRAATGADPGSVGPVDLGLTCYVDHSAAALSNFVCGANQNDVHLKGVNWQRDVPAYQVADLRNVVEGDESPDGQGKLTFKRGIEVGHIFQLGRKYSDPMKATVLDDNGKAVTMMMGCYGMGVTRLVAAILEQYHDDRGMVWPTIVAPFHVIIIPINAHKSPEVAKVADDLYRKLEAAGIEVLLDDRDSHRPGAKFADAELIGIPHRLVVGDRGLSDGVIEYANRSSGESEHLPVGDVVTRLTEWVNSDR